MLKRVIRRLVKSEAGSVTLEGILWIPLLTFVLAVIIDFSMVYHEKANIAQLVHKTNRAVSVGVYGTAAAAEAALTEELQSVVSDATVSVTKGDADVNTSVTVPASAVAAMGAISTFGQTNIRVSYTHLLEP